MRFPYHALTALILSINITSSTALAHQQAQQCPASRGPIRRVASIENWQPPKTTPSPEATGHVCAEYDRSSQVCIKERADTHQAEPQTAGNNRRRVVLRRQLPPGSALYYLGRRTAAAWLERYEQLQASAYMAVHWHNVRVAATRGNGFELKRGNYRVDVPKKFIMAVM